MDEGSSELGRRVGAHAAGIAFGLTYLWANLAGAGADAALQRGVVAAIAGLAIGTILGRPVVDVVLDALARDTAHRRAERAKEADA